MKPIPFFTDDISIVPHTVSADLGHLIGKRVTLAQFQKEVGATALSLYELPNGELYAAAKRNPADGFQPFFLEGSSSVHAQAAA
jgi:hypothetical protein